MIGYVKANGGPVDAFEARDALAEVKHDVHGAALALLSITSQGVAINPEQVEIIADVLFLAADELEALQIHVTGREQ